MKLFFTTCFFFILLCFSAQNEHMNNALKMRLFNKNQTDKLHTILVQGNISKLKSLQNQNNFTINYSSGSIASITCDLSKIALLIESKVISYAEFIEAHKQVLNDTMIYKNRIKAVKLWTAPLPQSYNGSGVLMGIIDTGIDFNHGDFKDAQGNTRIKFLWDQVPTSGSTVPAPFNYGIEWTAAQINANQCTHDDLPHYGHGTHVSGIAAGNGLANGTHEGVASQADIIAVALDFNKAGPTIADAVNYIFNKATLLGKPCVINASLGDYYGSHDATDLEAKLIETMVTNLPGRVMVAAAGNAGNLNFHVKTQIPANDTAFTWISSANATLDYWCYADTNQIKNSQLSIGANRSNYFDLGRIGFKNYNYALSGVKSDTLKFNNHRIGIVKTSASINNYGVYELYVNITADSSNLLWRIESKGVGLHHAWNFDFVANGLPTTVQYPRILKYEMPDSLYSMVSSFQCSDQIITVANYSNLKTYFDVTNTLQSTGATAGEIENSSSLGPTRNGKQKPDISATGGGIFSAMALGMQANLITNAPQAVAQGSLHVIGGGTSAASPVVAGLAALYLQRFPSATNQQVKAAITNCAFRDNFTGNNLPDYQWGYGKLDGKATMLCGETIYNAIGEQSLSAASSLCFPNPFKNYCVLDFKKVIVGKIIVYTPDGKLIFEDKVANSSYTLLAPKVIEQYEGLLFVKVLSQDNIVTFKLIKEK